MRRQPVGHPRKYTGRSARAFGVRDGAPSLRKDQAKAAEIREKRTPSDSPMTELSASIWQAPPHLLPSFERLERDVTPACAVTVRSLQNWDFEEIYMLNFTRRSALFTGAMAGLMLIAGCSGGKDTATEDTKAATVEAETGPAYALITQPAGKTAPADYVQQLSAARKSGEISNILLLRSKPSVEGPVGFASLAVVEFPDGAAFDKWSSGASAKLGKDLVVRRADLLVDERAKEADAKAAYVVSHYEALIPAEDYASYTRAYISPNMNGQKKGGVLTGYAMYYEREPVPGIKGNRTILVKQYVDEAAFGRSEAIKEKDKVELLKDPEWKRINDTKDTIRKDISGTLALPEPVN
jgi:hypothetical protein